MIGDQLRKANINGLVFANQLSVSAGGEKRMSQYKDKDKEISKK